MADVFLRVVRVESAQPANPVDGSARARPQLSEEGVAVLHFALDTAIADRDPASSTALRYAVKRICIDARRNEWPPESFLVAFKDALHTLPAVQHLPRGPERDEFVARLVSLCIDEYYRTQR